MSKGISVILIIFFFTSMISCEKRQQREVFYNETQCADPWENATNEKDKIENVKTFINSLGIQPISINIDQNGEAQACLACACLTGNRIIVKIHKDEVETLKSHGFDLKD